MIGRLVKQEQVCIVKHSSRELELHLPSTRQSPNGIRLALVIEADFDELVADFGPGHVLQSRIYSKIRIYRYIRGMRAHLRQ